MSAFWSGSLQDFLTTRPVDLVAHLADQQMRRFRNTELAQIRAWDVEIPCLQAATRILPVPDAWRVLLEYPLLRLGSRIDAVLVSDRAILVLEFKSTYAAADRTQAEDYALDLQDFHAGSRGYPIVPILVAPGAPAPVSWPLLLSGVTEVLTSTPDNLPRMLVDLAHILPEPARALSAAMWEAAPYRPVPTIIEAARMLYTRHGVTEIATARADAINLSRTTQAIRDAVRCAQAENRRIVVFVTGIPGAGKTLCGLNAVFGADTGGSATFLTGNPTLVHVLREALARDAASGARGALRVARQRVESAIQALPLFRDYHVGTSEIPAEHVAVIDEAQRCWTAAQAIAKTRDRRIRLSDSEPGHLLDIMARNEDWAAIICLIGGGQEIHTGEGGLAGWSEALSHRPEWQIVAPPSALTAEDSRQRLAALPGLSLDAALHLDVPVRSIRNTAAAPWVDAVLRGDFPGARRIATEAKGVPFRVTRELSAMRAALRQICRGSRRAGLIASSSAARLRADGLGTELPHMDAGAVARWFLDRWPDVRASDALEVVATEFSCQGLELDAAGLCWGGDLVPAPDGGWTTRVFHGTAWRKLRTEEAVRYRINTYRVLLTRARYDTIIWVPRGAAEDATHNPVELDRIAERLLECGAIPLEPLPAENVDRVPVLL